MKTALAHTNIRVAYLLSLVSMLFFPITAWLFFLLRYLDFQQVVLITAVGGIASLVFEIPTGAFADIVGRRTAIVLSYFLFSIAMVAYAYTQQFWIFIFLAVINSLVNALYSGSLEALVYDTLKEQGEEEQYEHVVSRMEALGWIGLFIGAVSGGFMYHFWFRLPYIAQAIMTFAAAIAALYLKEPSLDSQKYDMQKILAQNLQGFRELFHNLHVARISLFLIVIAAGYSIAAEILGFSQAREYGMDSRGVGMLFGAGYIISAAFSYLYPQMKKKVGVTFLFIASAGLLLTTFFLAQYVGMILGSLLIITRIASSTTFRNTRSIVLNRFVSSKNRATAISTMVLLAQLPYAIGAYWIGAYITQHGPNSFAFLLGTISLLALGTIYAGFACLGWILNSRQSVMRQKQLKA